MSTNEATSLRRSNPGDRARDTNTSDVVGTSYTTPYAEHGPGIDHKIPQAYAVPAEPEIFWSRIRRFMKEPFSEFLGTFILVMFGDGAIAQTVLSNGTKGSYLSISFGFGIGIMLGVYTAGISGAHINPAISLANCIFRKFPWKKLPVYALAQTLGAFCAAGVLYGNYNSAISVYEGGSGVRTVPGYSNTSTAGIFATYPAPFVGRTGQFFSEFIGSALLIFSLYALQDNGNLGAGNLTPLGLFMTLFGIATSFGWDTGFAVNPARDFGPRLMTACLGYGRHVWSSNSYYFWIPIVAPCLGCLFGGWLYDTFLFTGESPINRPWMGLNHITNPRKSSQGAPLLNTDSPV